MKYILGISIRTKKEQKKEVFLSIMYSCDRKQIKKKTLAEILLRFVFLTKKVKINYLRIPLISCENVERFLSSKGKLGSLACLTSSIE